MERKPRQDKNHFDTDKRRANYSNNNRRDSGNRGRRRTDSNRYDRSNPYRNNHSDNGDDSSNASRGKFQRANSHSSERPQYAKSDYHRTKHRNNIDKQYGRDFAKPRPKKTPYEVKKVSYSKKFVDTSKPIRLNKFIANSNICSRREADEYIKTGVVSVNGEIVTELGVKIIPDRDKVHFHDQLVSMDKKVYILLNKPKNVITTVDDPKDRKTVLDIIKDACTERIYPVGRLDRNTTGVLLLTNDGDLTSKLTHPKYEKKKIYHVRLNREFEAKDMEAMINGLILEDGEIKPDEVSYVKEDDKKQVGIEIHSGKNRIVRRMFEHLKYSVVALDRVYFAGLTKKNLPRGKWRYLSEREVDFLKMNSL